MTETPRCPQPARKRRQASATGKAEQILNPIAEIGMQWLGHTHPQDRRCLQDPLQGALPLPGRVQLPPHAHRKVHGDANHGGLCHQRSALSGTEG